MENLILPMFSNHGLQLPTSSFDSCSRAQMSSQNAITQYLMSWCLLAHTLETTKQQRCFFLSQWALTLPLI